jgi:hypothetical protein
MGGHLAQRLTGQYQFYRYKIKIAGIGPRALVCYHAAAWREECFGC